MHHALAAASRGLAVFPLSRGKVPAIRSPHGAGAACRGGCGRPGHGVHDASCDPGRVRALFACAPRATGYGIACGRAPHWLVGIDLDVSHGADSRRSLDLLAEAAHCTLPDTVTVLTPSGGRHLWLRGPADVRVANSVGRLGPGIDIRGAGGYLVGPGSVSVHGSYRLAPGSACRSPAPVPEALLRLLIPPPPPRPTAVGRPPTGARGAALVRFVQAAPVGQRNARLFWAACRAWESGQGAELAEPLVDAARATGLPEREARTTLASAARRTAALPG
ncbi:bifunctional DNA primase/polymerase [Streptomyces sp. 549]|uniref:bifunctional DNA primase/polymerase n=1 Tax=Streptomyces sp. 549 TaxID=3049076 RepID=UPI0024C4100F|nr:bifunctional DNA primase/polymerase [Streptomyces sp. 549]MDK1474959.1 bifunctional DNA primase/polymerase [Streptomyces sp. 549]